jgi:hypothetical protein
MKKLLTILLFILTISASGQTSVYHPFPDSSANWNFDHIFYCQWGNAHIDYSLSITVDTLINGQTYHKLFMPRCEYNPAYDCYPSDTISGYKGAIRQDTASKKVFIVPPFTISEQLLYDFNMLVGDTVKGYLAGYFPNTVESIDSVLVGNNYRKRWFVDHGNYIHIIEGIGSEYGLIRELPGNVLNNFNSLYLNCFVQNNKTLFPDTLSNCEIIYTVKSFDKTSDKIKVYPNPFNNSFTVDIDQSINVYEFYLTDLLGNIILRQQTNQQKRINIQNIKSGAYILTVIGNDNLIINERIISCL